MTGGQRHAWAAGFFSRHGVFHSLVVRWDGARWSRVPSPDPGDVRGASYWLTSISAVGSHRPWVAGFVLDFSRATAFQP